MIVGILAMQGAFEKHKQMLDIIGVDNLYVRYVEDLDKISAIILPGGESTVMIKLLEFQKLDSILKEKIEKGLPCFGTCAGLILLSKKIHESEQKTLNILDIEIKRNAYGNQLASFNANLDLKNMSHEKSEAVFIRAPRIEKINDISIEVLSTYKEYPVLIRKKNILASSFHPELTKDTIIHKEFLKMI